MTTDTWTVPSIREGFGKLFERRSRAAGLNQQVRGGQLDTSRVLAVLAGLGVLSEEEVAEFIAEPAPVETATEEEVELQTEEEITEVPAIFWQPVQVVEGEL